MLNIMKNLEPRIYPAGSTIYSIGSEVDEIIFVMRGEVRANNFILRRSETIIGVELAFDILSQY